MKFFSNTIRRQFGFFSHSTFLFFYLLSVISVYSQTVTSEYVEITVDSLKTIIDKNENILIIDVRTAEEFVGELGHVEGAILRPVQEINDWYGEFSNYKDKPIYFICRSGNRSGLASKFFDDRGFTQVYNIKGGMRAWKTAGYPIEKNIPEVLEEVIP